MTLAEWWRRRRLPGLRGALAAHLPVLPVAAAQLRETSRQLEEGVARVGACFEGMVARVREAVDEASRLLGREQSAEGRAAPSVDALLATSRATLEDLLARIVGDGEACQRLAGRMDALERDMAQVVKALAEVDRISFANTILALNAKIEAVHVGERGQGFELVAEELCQQARRAEEITEGIRATILRLAGEAKRARNDVAGMASANRSGIAAVEREVRDALEVLQSAHREMQASLAGAAARSEALAGDIHGAVVALQFQDRVSQRITHVIEAMESMHAAIAAPLDGRGENAAATSGAAACLAASYSMEHERRVHAATLGEAPASQAGGPDVELFV
jgi:methyl-accepting chemotaxis protein